jgi:anti-anti-sigma factor
MTERDGVEIVEAEDVVVARLIGAVDLANAKLLEDEVSGAVPNAAHTVVLDLGETTYLDSAGIRLVFGLAERLKRRGQGLRLVVPEHAPIERVLELANVAEVAALDRTLDVALAQARSR